MRLADLSRALLAADPGAVLVPQPVLDRVVRAAGGAGWALWRVPHNHCFLIDRYTLFRHVEQEELYLPPEHLLPEQVLLLARPAEGESTRAEDVLRRYWRRLFHVVLHREIGAALATVGEAGVRERVAALGPSAFGEARSVLRDDGLLTDRTDDRAAYVEFAATYWELRFFAPSLVPVYFPSLPTAAAVEELLGRDADAAALFAATRLEGAPDPDPKTDDQADESHDFYRRLKRQAEKRGAANDQVGAAILHTRSARVAPASQSFSAQAAAREELSSLVVRLQKVLNFDDDLAAAWRKVLPPLLDKADQGARPVEAALLYDLQRACQDYEQTPFALDVIEWLLSAGHSPIKRPLDGQSYVRLPAHLRAATRRLTAARLTDADRQSLAELLRRALDRSEEKLRDRFRGVLTEALRDAGLRPQTAPEQAALQKTVEELLDHISAVGFFSFADLRDAIARGQVKLPDLAGPQEYLRGDPLLRLDRRLAKLLDGVYRRGEFYSRALERATAFAFGTAPGRWVTLNVVLPFGGAFLLAQFLWLIEFERRLKVTGARETLHTDARPDEGPQPQELSFFGGWNEEWWFHLAWMVVGAAAVGVIRSAAARDALWRAGRAAYRGARRLFWEWPRAVWRNPRVRALLASGPVQLALNYVVKPLMLSAVFWLAYPDVFWHPLAARALTAVCAGVLLNSRVGTALEAALFQLLAAFGRGLRALPAAVRLISDLFREFVGLIEVMLARVEDYLRLRGEVSRLTKVLRGIASLAWFPVAFLIRFYMVVLVEPMINPIKLPLSILFAKFVYPLLGVMGLFTLVPLGSPLVADVSPPLPYNLAWLLVVGTLYLAPDAVTFLFWEMRENWKLYRANRPAEIGPVAVGPHGETVASLLRPGFHSGTVPKLFARSRAAERVGSEEGEWHDARAYRQSLRGVEEAVRRFAARDLAAVLNPSPAWGGRALSVGAVTLGTNRIRVELFLAGRPAPAALVWEEQAGWLVAGWEGPGWLPALPPGPARALANALAYLYKRAGVDLCREHLRAELPPEARHYEISRPGLLVWYGPRSAPPVLYDLGAPADDLRPRHPGKLTPAPGPVLSARRIVFSRVPLTWPQWLAVWRPLGEDQPPPFGPDDFDLTLLPPAPEPPAGQKEAG